MKYLAVLILGLVCPCQVALAGSLKVSSTSLIVPAPGKTASLTVSGSGEDVTAGQVRVVRWSQDGGQEKLAPTRDVVASPPVIRLDPGKDMTVRIVRVLKSPVVGEECYRVLVDQLPGANQDGLAIKFALRHSIPLCFDAAKQKPGEVAWSLQLQGKDVVLSGSNNGERRVVARNVQITAAKGASASLGAATVLGGSTMSWPLKGKLKGFTPGTGYTITATINGKAVKVTGKVGGG